MDSFEPKFKSTSVYLLPRTKRTEEYESRKREAEDKQRREMMRRAEDQKRDQERLQKLRMEQDNEARLKEERRREEERRQQEVLKETNTLKGKFGVLITTLRDNKSNYDLSIAGIKLIDAQVRALVAAVQHNTTLKILSMNRKKINDDDGADMIRSLCCNYTLERVDLEGNNLGPKTARAVGELLRTNKTLRHLNLESNNLTNLYKDNDGIFELAKGLGTGRDKNSDLLYLNLNNTNLDKACGEILDQNMRSNTTLIMLDIENNKNMNFQNVRGIQDSLKRNRALYDAERLKEWKERKFMKKEEENMDSLNIKDALEKEQDNFEARFQAKLHRMEKELEEQIEDDNYRREKMMKKLEKEAAAKKKKKKRGKKKKK